MGSGGAIGATGSGSGMTTRAGMRGKLLRSIAPAVIVVGVLDAGTLAIDEDDKEQVQRTRFRAHSAI